MPGEVKISLKPGEASPGYIFQKALNKLNLKPEEALYIGNRPRFDAEGPKNAGMQWFIVGGDVNLKSVLGILE